VGRVSSTENSQKLPLSERQPVLPTDPGEVGRLKYVDAGDQLDHLMRRNTEVRMLLVRRGNERINDVLGHVAIIARICGVDGCTNCGRVRKGFLAEGEGFEPRELGGPCGFSSTLRSGSELGISALLRSESL